MSEVIFIPYAQSYTPVSDVRLDLYWDPVDGEDTNDGLSTAAPVRTATRLMQLLPLPLKRPVLVHMSSGTFDFGGSPIPSLAGAERLLCFYGDFDWDPRGDLIDVIATGVAGAGTDGNTIVLPAPVAADDYESYSVRMIDGAAAGQVRSACQHPTTAITPSRAFSPAPAAGDTFEVFRSRAVVSHNSDSLVAQDNPGGYSNVTTGTVTTGVVFVNIGFSATCRFGPGLFLVYGMRAEGVTPIFQGQSTLLAGSVATAGSLAAQFGLPQALWGGWGFQSDRLLPQSAFTSASGALNFAGYVAVRGSIAFSGSISTWFFFGGSARGITLANSFALVQLSGPSSALPFQIGHSSTTGSVVSPGATIGQACGTLIFAANVALRHAGSASAALLLRGNLYVRISTTTLGSNPGTGPTLDVSRNAQVTTDGALNLGRAAADPNPNDIIVESLAAINKTAITAAGATSIVADPAFPGSSIRRMA
jgi:hypothetical protein